MKRLLIIILLFISFVGYSQTGIPELPKWCKDTFYFDADAPGGGDGSFENPWNDRSEIPSTYYSTTWPRQGWDYDECAILFKRGTTIGGSGYSTSWQFYADSIYIGSYGEGAKAKILFDNNNRGLRIVGDYNTLSYIEVANLDTSNFSEVVTTAGRDDIADPPRGADFFSDSLVISRGFRGLVIDGFRSFRLNNAVIYSLNHDGVYATNADSIFFIGCHIWDINRDWMWTDDINQAGGDCIQTTGYNADSRAEYIYVEDCILDHSYHGGKFALITNENDTTIIKNSVLKAQEESVALYASRTYAENTTFEGGFRCVWSHTISKSSNKFYNCIFKGPGKDYEFEGEANGEALYGTYMDVYNCTFIDWQYVFYVPGYNPNVRNSIFYNINNPFYIGYRMVDGSGNIHYNSDETTQLGLNSYRSDTLYQEVDPLFVDYPDDLSLQKNSPAIDAGDPLVYDATATFLTDSNSNEDGWTRKYTEYHTITDDIEGVERPQGDGYDIGAYEFVDKDSLNMLMVGNSFTDWGSIDEIVEYLASEAGYYSTISTSASGGSTLNDHRSNATTINAINAGDLDYIFLQDHSTTALTGQSRFFEDVVWFYDTIKASNPDATIVLYQTWVTHDYMDIENTIYSTWSESYRQEYDETQDMISEMYYAAIDTISANATFSDKDDVIVSPVGDVWAAQMNTEYEITLHNTSDYLHANTDSYYLIALTHFWSVYNEPTDGFGIYGIVDETNGGIFQTTVDSFFNALDSGETPSEPSSATDITSFTLSEQTGSATINTGNHTVSIEVENGTDVSDLTPTISVSSGATISPASGTAQNFTSPVTYTVTAEDETTTQDWTVTVTEASAPVAPSGNAKRSKISGKSLKWNGHYIEF